MTSGNLSSVPYDFPNEETIESQLLEQESRELKKFQEEWNIE